MSPLTRRTSPEDAQEIAAHAREHLTCGDCGAAPGSLCTQPGRGRTVCKSRFVAAAIELRQQAKAVRQTPEQDAVQAAVLAGLPRVSKEEIERCRTQRGGYAFTRAWFLEHGLPYPPVAGWRQAVARGVFRMHRDGGDQMNAAAVMPVQTGVGSSQRHPECPLCGPGQSLAVDPRVRAEAWR